ncbi:NAD-dependent epimerase/dehydratase family protein [uncultured Pseudoteredinibacter sp.]|uniref:NAD-dependent epimerase/dehydratase family protein n=1 Tax=uncultured Pseudoteredinibacter sp. TaxID=1641701 RepID=UPI0026271D7F|nr:NAD-dependent epimerase/dehydratase family protein [uncultured Pseudoteredinibacter sp.]
MKISIIGGHGFIGRAIAQKLVKDHELHIIARRSENRSEIPNIKYHYHSYESEKLLPVYDSSGLIINAAGNSTPLTFAQEPSKEVHYNLMHLAQFIELLHKIDTPLVYISTGGAIYQPSSSAIAENHPLGHWSYYGAAKQSAETFLSSFSQQTGKAVTILRPSNIYGEGQPLKPNFGVIPTLFDAAINQRKFHIIGSGQSSRDYLHIEDFTAAIEGIISCKTFQSSNTFNLGSGAGTSLIRLIELVETISQQKIERVKSKHNIEDNHIILNSNKLQNKTHWRPTIDLTEGLNRVWREFNATTF